MFYFFSLYMGVLWTKLYFNLQTKKCKYKVKKTTVDQANQTNYNIIYSRNVVTSFGV